MTRPTITRVVLNAGIFGPSSVLSRRYTGDPEDGPPVALWDTYEQVGKRGPWVRVVEQAMDSWTSWTPNELHLAISMMTWDQEDVKVQVEHRDGSYGDGCETYLELTGRRPATKEEIAWVEKQLDMDQQRMRENQEARAQQVIREAEALRKERPDLFT